MIANQVIETCDSTNDLARKLGEEGAPHGSWVSARTQSKGRGRLGREWQSLEGNLFLSIIVRLERKDRWTWIPMATAIAIADALNQKFQGLGVQVKWPNDLWIDRRKLGGILCEAVGGREGSFVVIGIGLNCAIAPEGLDQLTTSLSERMGRVIRADDIRERIVESVLVWMDLDLEKLAAAYERLAALPIGTAIEWGANEKGKILGLGPSGELRVLKSDGDSVSLYAEDVKIRPSR